MTEEILQQLKHPEDRFAACASRPGCPHKAECLRALVWEHSELATIKVLRKDECHFLPLRTEEKVWGISHALRDQMKYSEYLSFIHGCINRIGKTVFYRIRNAVLSPTVEQRRVIEQQWAKHSTEPFRWNVTRQCILWGKFPW